jgi:hypothetical protein
MKEHPLAAAIAAAVAGRDSAGLAAAVTDTVRLRALLPAGPGAARHRWACTQTSVCKTVDGRLATIDLLCSGFRKVQG